MNKDIINDCINLAIEKKACKIINEYVKYWSNCSKFVDYDIEQLDAKYYYLLYCQNKKIIDIFTCCDSIFTTLFLVLY